MNVGFLKNIPWPRGQSSENVVTTIISDCPVMEAPEQMAPFNLKLFGWSILTLAPWAINARNKIRMPTTVNKELKKRAQPHSNDRSLAQYSTIRFRPYVSKVPWHTGVRAFLSQFFPRYGHYCGPNWSSGKDGGSPIWDKRPIDWLDFCCYCHDIGYDTHNQAELLKADLAFLECLESPRMNTKGDPQVASLYKTMCISGIRNVLIPYRQNLLRLQAGQLPISFEWLSGMKLRRWNLPKDFRVDILLIPKGWLSNLKWKGRNLHRI